MKQLLTTADPLASEGCSRNCCPVHCTRAKGDCKKPGALYRHVCMAPTCTADGKVVGRLARQGLLEENSSWIQLRWQEKVRARQIWTMA